MKEAFEKIRKRIEEITVSRDICGFIVGCNMGECEDDDCLKCLKKKILSIVSEVEEEYTKNIMDELLEAKKNCGEDSDCTQCIFGCEDGCRLQELQITGGNNGWIPCSERLPEIWQRVLLWVYGRSHIGKRIDAKLFEYDVFGLESGACESTKRIKAWRPLPEPYKPET